MRDGLQAMHIVAGRADAFRFPLLFEALRWVPPSLLHATFYGFVVVGTSLLVLRLSSEPLAAVTVACYLLLAGQEPVHGGSIQMWMLVELWSVPFLAGAFLAHRARRWWLAAALVAVAVLIRELNAVVLVGGLLYAQRQRLPRRPWLVATFGCAVAFAVHLQIAAEYVRPHGNDAKLLGTGSLASVASMLDYRPTMPVVAGLLLWALAWWRVRQLGILALVAPLLAVPLLGLLVYRPYWGFVVMPFVVMWSTEAVSEAIHALVARGRRVPVLT
jgi:hypothetical protein